VISRQIGAQKAFLAAHLTIRYARRIRFMESFMRSGLVVLGVSALLLSGFRIQSGEKNYEDFKPHMRAVYSSLLTIFPLTLNTKSFTSKDNSKAIQENLNQIALHAKEINTLAAKDEKGHAYLSLQLERNARQAALKYKDGFHDQAHFFVEELYDTCLSCHTSRSSSADSAFTMDLSKNLDMEAMGTFGKAKFLALSRQFDRALDEYERILKGRELSLEELLHFDPLVDYLVLSVRVKGDPDRPLKTFNELLKRPLPGPVKHDLEAWQKSLKQVKNRPKKMNDLQFARTLIKDVSRDRQSLVSYIFASKYLKDHLKKVNITAADKAETYYQLGICELSIGESLMSGESGMYLEESIRLAPKAPFAKRAYELYEESVTLGYTGSSGIHLPADEKARLDELKKLVF
jgi:tetratricopeptide (TPR) repeat protein